MNEMSEPPLPTAAHSFSRDIDQNCRLTDQPPARQIEAKSIKP